MTLIGDYCFGTDYRDAHLSKIHQSEENISKLHAWTLNPRSLLYFCGSVGTGKTYFAVAWWNFLKEQNCNVRVFTEQLLFSYLMGLMNQNQDPHYELKRICETEYFILDDMGSSKPSEWKDEMLLAFVNYRTSNSLPTLITSNLNRSDLKEMYHERFASRIYDKKNTIIELRGPDRRLT